MSRRFYLACATIAAGAIGAIAWAELAEAQEEAIPRPHCVSIGQLFADMHKAEMSEVAVGLINPKVSFVVFASPGGARWVMVTIGTTGAACPVMSGTGWDNEPIVPTGRQA